MTDYIRKIEGKKEREHSKANPKDCDNVILSSMSASKLEEENLKCTNDATITCGYSSTIIIDKLECKDATIDVKESSTVRIKHIKLTGTCTINVDHSSTLKIEAGSVYIIKGIVTYSSTGICEAKIKKDDVKHEHASRWEGKKKNEEKEKKEKKEKKK